jgi:hypothetical protein
MLASAREGRNHIVSDAPGPDFVDTARCPGCGERSTLDPMLEVPGSRECHACYGWFFARESANQFIVEEMGVSSARVAEMLKSPGPGQRTCPACDRLMSEIQIGPEAADLCGHCGAAWFQPGVLATLTGGRIGAVPERAAPAPVSALGAPVGSGSGEGVPVGGPPGPLPMNPFGNPEKSQPISLASGGPSFRAIEGTAPNVPMPDFSSASSGPVTPGPTSGEGVPMPDPLAGDTLELARPVSGSGEGAPAGKPRSVRVGRRAPERKDPPRPAPASGRASRSTVLVLAGAAALALLVAVGAGAFFFLGDKSEDAPPEAKAADATEYQKYLAHYRFGGRTASEWKTRLNRLAPGGPEADEALFALAKKRAHGVGLEVVDGSAGFDVKIAESLAARLLDRLGAE